MTRDVLTLRGEPVRIGDTVTAELLDAIRALHDRAQRAEANGIKWIRTCELLASETRT